MKVRIPQEYDRLPPAQRKRITEYCRDVAYQAAKETTERDGRIMLELYIKMVCKTLHDTFGFGEKRLYLFLGNHKRLCCDSACLTHELYLLGVFNNNHIPRASKVRCVVISIPSAPSTVQSMPFSR
jgi:hypothetical protein